jgi:hypothetical protein
MAPLHNKYLASEGAVDKMNMAGPRVDHLAIVIPLEDALRIPDAHFNAFGWAYKEGKPGGRQTQDCSSGEPGEPLNSVEAKVVVKEEWGAIETPTVQSLSRMIVT